ncbi:3-keto-5-aminohexanoate cleavage protein [Sinorhizobium sp. 7-81]|uniref:3-keto-5-aminohexanoate cleavage protein n=1 Tax=Sinorhizobium sp. 8-89 TaxID=3049089 RepID=UPI0024C3A257|nr:3-keto-5-aminohexanoate cleavage protein [Sinorhizobium sp. 8-89]MDK1492921.1 3-keto-5-aminohexanoate cleavage protein [Sinorhizobium sp. 8-89]
MNREPFITCAVTGGGDFAGKSPHVPVTPLEIADSALEAHEAGAAIVHLHVRDPETRLGSRDIGLYRELVTIIRERNKDVIINLTGGMGGEILFSSADSPLPPAVGTDFVGPAQRMEHILELKPEIASLDTGSLNFDDSLYATTPTWLRAMADSYKHASVLPEIEVFELGHIELAKQLIKEGRISQPALFQLCLGIKYGAPATPDAMMAMRNALPAGAIWAGFGLGAMQLPMAAQAVLMGGNIRVGLEDNLYLERGVLATNAQLVAKARQVAEAMGAKIRSASETRALLNLRSRG